MSSTLRKVDPDKIPLLGEPIYDLVKHIDPKDTAWSTCNPSIAYSPEAGYVIAFRSSNYVIKDNGGLEPLDGKRIHSRVWFAEIDGDLVPRNLREVKFPNKVINIVRGVEDPKPFWRDGSWWFTGVVKEDNTYPTARMGVFKLNQECTEVVSAEVFAGVDVRKPEKNWMLPDLTPNPNFDFIYGPNSIVKDNKVIYTMTTCEELTGLRGNTNIIEQEDGTYIAVVHRLWTTSFNEYDKTRMCYIVNHHRNYAHYFVRIDQFGTTTHISPAFRFISKGIEFCAGIVSMGDDFVLSFGKEDTSSHLTRIAKSKVLPMLRSLEIQ